MSSAPPSVSPSPAVPLPVVTAQRWDSGGRRTFGARYQNTLLVFTTLIFALSVPALWLLGYTFWVLIEAVVQGAGLPRGASVIAWALSHLPRSGLLIGGYGWPLDVAFILGCFGVWCGLYLGFDHVALWGNVSAQASLWAKTVSLLPDADRSQAFFVEARPGAKRGRLVTDTGFLLVLPDKLLFLGDVEKATFPRAALAGEPRLQTQWAGLGASWVWLPLDDPARSVRFVARDTARTLSGTRPDCERLHTALAAWYAQKPDGRAVPLPL